MNMISFLLFSLYKMLRGCYRCYYLAPNTAPQSMVWSHIILSGQMRHELAVVQLGQPLPDTVRVSESLVESCQVTLVPRVC